jgi:transcriptional regulator with XRE-family HTH domain
VIFAIEMEQMPRKSPPTNFGRLLRKFRDRRGFTQEALADAIGVSHVAVGDWERGKRNPRQRNMESLIACLDLSGAESDELLRAWVDPDGESNGGSVAIPPGGQAIDIALNSGRVIKVILESQAADVDLLIELIRADAQTLEDRERAESRESDGAPPTTDPARQTG